MAEADERPMIPIVDKTGTRISVERKALDMMLTYNSMIDDLGEESANEDGIPSQIEPSTLRKIIEWCTHHRFDPPFPTEIADRHEFMETYATEFDKGFLSSIDNQELPYMLQQVDYLDISSLLAFLVRECAYRIKGKSPQQLRQEFELGPPPSEEEQQRIREEFSYVTQSN